LSAHRCTLRVRFSELDPYAHVNHAVYLVYFEQGRVEAMLSAGIDLARLQGEGWQMVVVELTTRYRVAAVANDELVVETGLVELAGASSRWHQRLLRGDDEVVCTTDVRIAVTDERGRPRRVPAELRARLEQLRQG
jgi:YbgC/YbaW family acyl-CoA thioester hydrolase